MNPETPKPQESSLNPLELLLLWELSNSDFTEEEEKLVNQTNADEAEKE